MSGRVLFNKVCRDLRLHHEDAGIPQAPLADQFSGRFGIRLLDEPGNLAGRRSIAVPGSI